MPDEELDLEGEKSDTGFADDYAEIQERLSASKKEKPATKPAEEVESDESEERVTFSEAYAGQESPEGFKMGVEGDIREAAEEEEVEEEEVKETPAKETGKPTVPQEPALSKEDQAITEQILSLVGKDTMLNIKGKQYKISDIPQEELKNYFQKGYRFYDEMKSLAQTRKELDQLKADLNTQAKELRAYQAQVKGSVAQPEPGQDVSEYMKYLEPSPLDTDDVKALKGLTKALAEKVQGLTKGADESTRQQASQRLINEFNELATDYPMASPEDCIAFHVAYPQVPLRDIVAKSHEHYSSLEHVKAALKSNPQAERELKEAYIAEYIAKAENAPRVPRKPSSSVVSKKVTTAPQKPQKITFDNVEALARKYLAERKRIEGEGDLQ